jgi:hypothetical protein
MLLREPQGQGEATPGSTVLLGVDTPARLSAVSHQLTHQQTHQGQVRITRPRGPFTD